MTGTKDVGPVPPTEEPQVTQAWVFVCLFVCFLRRCVAVGRLVLKLKKVSFLERFKTKI